MGYYTNFEIEIAAGNELTTEILRPLFENAYLGTRLVKHLPQNGMMLM